MTADRDKKRAYHREYMRAWRKANLDKKRAYDRALKRAWRKANPDKARAADKKWYYTNQNKISAARRALYKANPDKYRTTPDKQRAANKKWKEANPDRRREIERKWCESNPDKIATKRRNRRARKKQAGGTHTAADVAAIRALQNNSCEMCKVKLGRHGHLDHIIPLSRGGSNWPHNLQWLCASCNLAKGAKDPRTTLIT